MIRGLVLSCALLCLEAGCGGATRSNPKGRGEEPAPAAEGGSPGASESGATGAGEVDSPSAGQGATGAGEAAAAGGEGGSELCSCVDASIAWWVDDPDRSASDYVGRGDISPCSQYVYVSQRGAEPALIDSHALLFCDGPFGVETINAALADPDVRQALAGPSEVFGWDRRAEGGQVDHIEVNGRLIVVGDPCLDAQPDCDIPAGVANLDHLLAKLEMAY